MGSSCTPLHRSESNQLTHHRRNTTSSSSKKECTVRKREAKKAPALQFLDQLEVETRKQDEEIMKQILNSNKLPQGYDNEPHSPLIIPKD